MEVLNIKREIETLCDRLAKVQDCLNLSAIAAKIENLQQLAGQPGFWEDITALKLTLQQIDELESYPARLNQYLIILEDVKAAVELLEFQLDDDLLQEAQTSIARLNRELEQLELEQLLSDPSDQNGAFLTINAGSDELDAQDWAGMLLRMYCLWGQKGDYQLQRLDSQEDYVGIKSATIQIEGRYAYGYLKSETGTHRIRRISPFNITKKQQTTATVEVTPIVELVIPEKHLEIKHAYSNVMNINGMRHPWVKIVHIPTGISVTSSQERSQLRNKEKALAIIKSKLFAIAQRQFVKDISEIDRDRIAEIFTHPIRDYAFYPSEIVRDLRTGFETNAVAEVLAGHLNPAISAYLRMEKKINGNG
ncbi:MAG TPA: PCRF domain-containing protein [Kamptonema sp.]|nr:PCRF domain-containing protein [Kamptonema sp.]